MKLIGKLFAASFGIVWIAGWSAGTLFMDYEIGSGIYKQWQARSYTQVSATITQSKITTSADGEGGTDYKPVITYRYTLAGKDYDGKTIRHGTTSSSKSWAEAATQDYPRNSQRTVYVNPADATDSVLQAGLSGIDVFASLFMAPFNAIMIASWAVAIGWLRRTVMPATHEQPVIKRRRISKYDTRETLHIETSRAGPIACALGTIAVGAFIAIFAIAIFTGFDAPLPVATGAWVAIGAAACYVGVRRSISIKRGLFDIVIDPTSGTLRLPHFHKRKELLTIPLDLVVDFELNTETKRDSDGDKTTKNFLLVHFIDKSGEPATERITDWSDADEAEAVIAWLKQQMPSQ